MVQLELLDDELFCNDVFYAFRDKKTGLFVGYDGFDTDFSKGVSAFIQDKDLLLEFNKKLIVKTQDEIIKLITNKLISVKEWDELGGANNLDIVQLETEIYSTIFSPDELLQLITQMEADEDNS